MVRKSALSIGSALLALSVSAAPDAASLGLDVPPVPGQNLDYQPQAGEVSLTNPPAFRWIPAKGDGIRYRLEVAADREFKDLIYQAKELEYRIEVPTKPFPAGKYFWRYGVETPGGVVWSRVRDFTITAEAGIFPYPEASFTDRISKARPRLFVRADELPAFRKRAADGDLKGMAEALLKRVQGFTGEELVAEPQFLPADDSRNATYAVIFRATRPPMDKMEQAGLAYLLTGNRQAGEEAKRRVLHFFGWNPKGSTELTHNDEPAMWLMMRGVRAYDWTYNLYTPEERAKIEKVMLERTRQLYDYLLKRPFDNNPFESHAGRMTGFMGEAAIELIPEHPEAKKYLDYALRIYYGAYPCWGGPEGGWNEGTHYWASYMEFITHFLVAVKQATGLNLAAKPFFKNTPYYLYYSTPPFGKRQVFGDGYAVATPGWYGSTLYVYALLNRDPRLKFYAEQAKSLMTGSVTAIVQDRNLESKAPTDLPTSRLFADVGLVALRNTLVDGDNHVGMKFHSNPYGAVSHGHEDQNAFAIEAFGEPLAIPTGYYNYYYSKHHKLWTRSTRAKCAITTDGGKGQDIGPAATGKITDFADSPLFTVTSGDATAAYGGRLTRSVRDVVFLKQAGVFVVRDELASATPRSFEYWLHALDEMKVDEKAQRVLITRPGASLAVRFFAPAGLKFKQFTAFDPPVLEQTKPYMVDNYHLTAATGPVEATQFLSVLAAVKAGAKAPEVGCATVDGVAVVTVVAADGRRYQVRFAAPGKTLPGSPARFAASEVDAAGKVIASLEADGIKQAALPF